MTEKTNTDEEIVDVVKDRYAAIAVGAQQSCCGPTTGCCASPAAISSDLGYASHDLDLLPEGTNLGLGCGAPLEILDLQKGESVLDLGSGAGVDVLVAARQVGAQGQAIGVDMTPEMVQKAATNALKAGLTNVDFRLGRLEELPIGDASVDAVTSNCVINLVPDKPAVFKEIARVLRPGGRLGVSDIVLDGPLPQTVSNDVLAYVGCVAGAIERSAYFDALKEAGLTEIEVKKDIDFMAFVEGSLPAELQKLLDRTGVTAEDLKGKVRSLTYVARKRSEE
ncbi:MAG: arsenite methyltransferase [bacterium]|nr:arsenite methyltransferase [bacterium]